MLGTLRAFGYLTWHTLRNRALTRLRRARQPRYAFSAVIGIVYAWFFLVRNTGQMPQSIGSTFVDLWVLVTTTGLLIFACTWWMFGGDQTTLAFSLAETSFLFPAPISRKAVIGYKLFRAQLTILINGLIFIVLMRRGLGYLAPGYRAVSLWILFTTMNFHRIGAALVRASWVEHKLHAWRRNTIPVLTLATLIVCVSLTAFRAWPHIRAVETGQGWWDAISPARHVIETAPASIVLWPFRAITAPVFAMSPAEWLAALPAAFLVLALHAWWVVRSDAAFEEGAIAASYERVRRIDAWRSRRMSAPKPESISRSGIRIPAWGHPAIAIVWKNALCLRRTIQLRTLIGPLTMAIIAGLVTSGNLFDRIAVGALAVAGAFVFFGPLLMRNDLRHDMANLVALKVLPLSGRTIVMAEVMSSALPIAVVQYALLIVAAIASQITPEVRHVGLAASVVIVALPALVAFATAMVAIQNGAPVLFPGWVRIGTRVSGGMENVGQGVISLSIILILAGILLLVPVAFVAATVFVLKPVSFALAIVTATVVASAALGAETYGVFIVLGRALERTEPSEGAFAS